MNECKFKKGDRVLMIPWNDEPGTVESTYYIEEGHTIVVIPDNPDIFVAAKSNISLPGSNEKPKWVRFYAREEHLILILESNTKFANIWDKNST